MLWAGIITIERRSYKKGFYFVPVVIDLLLLIVFLQIVKALGKYRARRVKKIAFFTNNGKELTKYRPHIE